MAKAEATNKGSRWHRLWWLAVLSPVVGLLTMLLIAANSDLPIVIHSADASPEQRLKALRAGADDILPKPADDRILLARLRALLRRRDPAGDDAFGLDGLHEHTAPFDWAGLITLTTSRPDAALRLNRQLAPHLSHRLILRDRETLLGTEIARAEAGPATPDAYLIDGATDPASALVLLSELRTTEQQVVQERVLELDTLLEQVAQRDGGVQRTLEGRRGQIARALAGVQTARSAASAYGGSGLSAAPQARDLEV